MAAVIEATGIVQAIFEEIQTKAFDEETTSNPAKERSLLTPVLSLGKDSSEVFYYHFDDIDDYNNFNVTDSANVMGTFFKKLLTPRKKSGWPKIWGAAFLHNYQIHWNKEYGSAIFNICYHYCPVKKK